MRPALKTLTLRDWFIIVAGSAAVIFLVGATTWSVRHAWAIYKLRDGVGDTVFYDAAGRPWFRLD